MKNSKRNRKAAQRNRGGGGSGKSKFATNDGSRIVFHTPRQLQTMDNIDQWGTVKNRAFKPGCSRWVNNWRGKLVRVMR